MNQSLSDDPQIAQRKQGDELRCVLGQPSVARLAVAKLALDHPKRMLHLGAHTGLEFFHPLFERPDGRLDLERLTFE